LGHGMTEDARRQGFGHARSAFAMKATLYSASLLTRQAGAIPELEAEIVAFCKETLSVLRNDRGGQEQDDSQQGEAAKEMERFLRSRQEVSRLPKVGHSPLPGARVPAAKEYGWFIKENYDGKS